MAHVIPSLVTASNVHLAHALSRRVISPGTRPLRPTSPSPSEGSATPRAAPPAGSTPAIGTPPAAATVVPDFRVLFSGTVTSGVPEPVQKPMPTAESVFGPNPWMTNPTGVAPNGQIYSYNPWYFATPQTASKVAQMIGGEVVSGNLFTPNSGGGFSQQQPNYMVKLPDGRLINAGLVASLYAHGYPQAYVDELVANEIRNT